MNEQDWGVNEAEDISLDEGYYGNGFFGGVGGGSGNASPDWDV